MRDWERVMLVITSVCVSTLVALVPWVVALHSLSERARVSRSGAQKADTRKALLRCVLCAVPMSATAGGWASYNDSAGANGINALVNTGSLLLVVNGLLSSWVALR